MRFASLTVILAASCVCVPLSAAAQSEPSPHIRNAKAATAGVMTVLAGGLVFAGGTAWWRSEQAHPSGGDFAIAAMARPLVFLGATAIANGVPLAMFGLSERRPRRPAIYGGGLALTTIGTGMAAAGASMLALADRPRTVCTPYEGAPHEACGTVHADLSLPLALLAGGGAAAVTGFVLWRIGDQPRVASDDAASRAIPEVSIGAAAGSLRWRF